MMDNVTYYLQSVKKWEKESSTRYYIFSVDDLKDAVIIANLLRFAGHKVKITGKKGFFKLVEVERR